MDFHMCLSKAAHVGLGRKTRSIFLQESYCTWGWKMPIDRALDCADGD